MIRKILILFLFLYSITSEATNYYVNDASSTGDVYTTATGNAGFNGLTSATPKLSIQAIISGYSLVAGDNIYIDAGTYTEDITITGIGGASFISFIGAGSGMTTLQGSVGGNIYTVQITNTNRTLWNKLKIIGIAGESAMNIHDLSSNNEISNCIVIGGQYGIDIIQNGPTGPPTNNKVHDCSVSSNYVGIRMKYGATGTEIYDNIIRVSNSPGTVYAAVELQYATNNSVYRNKISSFGNSDEGTIHLGHYSTGNFFQNNYITNETATSGTYMNANIEIDDDNSSATFFHNSMYSVGPSFHMDQIAGATTATNFIMRNNIYYSTNSVCISLPLTTSKFQQSGDNMYYAPAAGNVANLGGTTMTFSAWQTYDPDAGSYNETNGLYANPQFTAPATGNLDLISTSPAIDAVAEVIASVLEDIYKTARPVGPKRDIGAFELTTPMPVELVNLNIDCNNDQLTITWATASEKNNNFFTIESSLDSKTFKPVATIPGKNINNQLTSYSYSMNNSESGIFRLSQTDINNKRTELGILTSNCATASSVQIYSTLNGICFQVNNSETKQYDIIVYDVIGQKVWENSYTINSSHDNFEIGYELSQGAYIVIVKDILQSNSFRVIKK